VLFVVQVLLVYLLTNWAYHSGRTPSWFDNFVQESGIWKVYGDKLYEVPFSDEFWFDPGLDFVEDNVVVVKYGGYIDNLEIGDKKADIRLSHVDREDVEIEIDIADIEVVCVGDMCDGSIDDIGQEGLLEVVVVRDIPGGYENVYLYFRDISNEEDF